MRPIKALFFILVASSSIASTLGAADGPAHDRDTVFAALQGYEWSAIKAAASLNGTADRDLIDVASDAEVASLYRQRARAVLAELRTRGALDYLIAALRTSEGVVDRRRLVDALCAGFADTDASHLTPVMVPLLAAEDAHLRVRAASCLLRPGFETAGPALEKYQRRVQGTWEARAAGINND